MHRTHARGHRTLSALAALALPLVSACVVDEESVAMGRALDLAKTGDASQAIFSGEATSEFPGTAALTRGSGQIACSGTLIAPRIVLTAAHCIDVQAQVPVGGFGIFFGTDPSAAGGVAVATMTKFIHPQWDPESESNTRYNNDIALLVLEEAPAGIEPVPLYEGPLTDNSIGRPVTLVGFGVANDDEEFGIKRKAETEIAWVGSKQVAFIGPEGTCSGDSGGPTYIEELGVQYVMSVHSTVSGCGNISSDVRVDAHLDSFLLPKIAEIEAILATEPEEPEPEAGDGDGDDGDDGDDDGEDDAMGDDDDTGGMGCASIGASSPLFGLGALALLLVRRRRQASRA